MHASRWTVVTLGMVAVSLTAGRSRADFELPLLSKVEKTLSFSDAVDPEQAIRFADVRDLTIEIRLHSGDMLPAPWLAVLMDRFHMTPKRIVLSQIPGDRAIERLRKLERLEVVLELPSLRSLEELERLYALGPVRKRVVLPRDFDSAALMRAVKLNFSEIGIALGDEGSLNREIITRLAADKNRRKYIYLPGSTGPETLLDLTALAPLAIQVKTVRNRLPQPLLSVLKDLRGIDVVLEVDGRITREDAQQWTALERFSLLVRIDDPAAITPGLANLLNGISPP